jgi:hypothetical protein
MHYSKCLIIIAGVGSILTTTTARAAVSQDSFLLKDTGALVEMCSADKSDPLYTAAVNFCHGFSLGVFRVLRDVDAQKPAQPLFCLPNPMPSRNTALTAFVQWAKADPNRLAQRPEDGLAAFLAQQYPCGHTR